MTAPVLAVEDLAAGYGKVAVLRGFDLVLNEGELVTVIGANGAGKTTLLRTICGLGAPLAGRILVDGHDVTRSRPEQVTAAGVALVPENRRVFPHYSVVDNLRLGAWGRRSRSQRRAVAEDADRMCERFPRLGERRTQDAGTMSGGEQQMLAIAMALMARPRVLLLDEPSLGLAPIYVDAVFDEIRDLKAAGTTILLVEQLANLALGVADRGVVLQHGRSVAAGTSAELAADDRVRRAYLGVT